MLCFVLQRTPTNENNGGTEWQGIQQPTNENNGGTEWQGIQQLSRELFEVLHRVPSSHK